MLPTFASSSKYKTQEVGKKSGDFSGSSRGNFNQWELKLKKQKRIGLGFCIALAGSPLAAVMAQDGTVEELLGYRVQSDDCPMSACGVSNFSSQAALNDYLKANAARLASLADGTGGVGNTFVHDSDDDDDDDDQIVFLDFNAGGSPQFPVLRSDGSLFGIFNDHLYTVAERDTIQARLEADYGEFDYEFTQNEPTSGDFTTIRFGQNDAGNITVFPTGGVSILFGRADNIDFRNINKTDGAFADPSFWEFLAQLDPSGGLFTAFSGIPSTAATLTEAVSMAVVNQSANTGAHELGHVQGLRHHDSFGAPGDGLPTTGTPAPGSFIPVFEGPQNAAETTLHTMASGASVGLTLAGSTISDRFLSERSAIKIAFAEEGSLFSEAGIVFEDDDDGDDGDEDEVDGDDDDDDVEDGIQEVELKELDVPNTIIEGVNATTELNVVARVVQGNISVSGEVDSYRFEGKAGEFMNVEMVSFSDNRFLNPVIGAVTLSLLEDDGSLTEIASNIQTFEPFDPLVFDAPLPQDGTYVINVDAPNFVFFDFTGDGIPDAFPLDETGNGALRVGDYELLLYMCNHELGHEDDDEDDD